MDLDLRRAVSNRLNRLPNVIQRASPAGLAEAGRERLERREERRLVQAARRGRDVAWSDKDESEPLVTVTIPTYNRGEVVVERSISAALRQTYERIEVLVIGDHCDDKTAQAVQGVPDPRVRFINLPARGLYPSAPRASWLVAGTNAMNAGILLAAGAWIAPCDDDDEFTEDHVELLLAAARSRQLEMVYSKSRCEITPGEWRVIGRSPLRFGRICRGSVLYCAGLRHLRYSSSCWKLGEPADWNLWKRMRAAGVRIGFLDEETYIHFLEAPKRFG